MDALLCTKSERRLLRLIIDGNRKYGDNYYQSKTGMASLLDISVKTVRRGITKLIQLGFIIESYVNLTPVWRIKKMPDFAKCPTNVPQDKNSSLQNDNDASASGNVQYPKRDWIGLQELNLPKKDIPMLVALAKKNLDAMHKAIADLKAFSQKETVRNPVGYICSKWNKYANPRSTETAPELAGIDLNAKDKEILSAYEKRDRKAFLMAYEDFKSYSMFHKVGNIAAVITQRFKSYLAGEVKEPVDSEKNKKTAEWVESVSIIPRGTGFGVYSACVVFSSGMKTESLKYDDQNFEKKFLFLLNKWNIRKRC